MTGLTGNRQHRSQLVFYLATQLPPKRKEALAVVDALQRAVLAVTPVRAKRTVRQRRR